MIQQFPLVLLLLCQNIPSFSLPADEHTALRFQEQLRYYFLQKLFLNPLS